MVVLIRDWGTFPPKNRVGIRKKPDSEKFQIFGVLVLMGNPDLDPVIPSCAFFYISTLWSYFCSHQEKFTRRQARGWLDRTVLFSRDICCLSGLNFVGSTIHRDELFLRRSPNLLVSAIPSKDFPFVRQQRSSAIEKCRCISELFIWLNAEWFFRSHFLLLDRNAFARTNHSLGFRRRHAILCERHRRQRTSPKSASDKGRRLEIYWIQFKYSLMYSF